MSQNPVLRILATVVIKSNVFKFHELLHDLALVFVLLNSDILHLLELVLLHLHNFASTLQELLEYFDLVLASCELN